MDCKLCFKEITGAALCCSKGSLCPKCMKDIGLAEMQPLRLFSDILWTLAETYFRKGRGEEITFRETWEQNNKDMKLITFMELFKKENYTGKAK